MKYLPLFLDLSAGLIAVVGSDHAALAKLRLLREAGAAIRWFPCAADAPVPPQGAGRLEICMDDPMAAELGGIVAMVASGGGGRDASLAARLRAAGIPVNVVDRPELSTFIFPAIVDRGDVVVAVGTGGTSPVLARRLRQKIEALLPARIGELASLVGRYRARFAASGRRLSPRAFWEQVIDGPIADLVQAGRPAEAEAALLSAIDARDGDNENAPGIVYLVGAGPGDPDLLTLRAAQALADADVVFHDELVTAGVLERARRDAARVFVGKRAGEPGIGQDEINRRLAEAARRGQRVVRLKGGDPFVFGRGGEELEYLRGANVRVVVVPGITAALGCAAEQGLPLTFRNEATQVSFVTAHRAAAAESIDWKGLSDRKTTIVVYMGLQSAAAVRDGLLSAGRSPQTPVAVLSRGTRPDAEAVTGRLEDLATVAASAGAGPALLVIGDVVARSDAWRARAAIAEAA